MNAVLEVCCKDSGCVDSYSSVTRAAKAISDVNSNTVVKLMSVDAENTS